MKDAVHITASYFGNPQLSGTVPEDRQNAHSPLEIRTHYFNYTNRQVSVALRSGMKISIPPAMNTVRRDFVVRLELIMKNTVKTNADKAFCAVGEESSPEMKILRDAYAVARNKVRFGNITLFLDYAVSWETLVENGGSVYYHDLDVLLSNLEPDSMPSHPYAWDGHNNLLLDVQHTQLQGFGFGYSVKLVDNARKFGDRFLNIAGKVYRVPTQVDPTTRDGVYLVSNQPVVGDFSPIDAAVKYYPFDRAEEEVGLYRTKEDALNLGDLATARKEEITRLEHTVNIQKVELQASKAKSDRDELTLKESLAIAERRRIEVENLMADINHGRELEKTRVRDFYEEKSHKRKDTTEWVKFIPAAVVGIGSILALAMKIFWPK